MEEEKKEEPIQEENKSSVQLELDETVDRLKRLMAEFASLEII